MNNNIPFFMPMYPSQLNNEMIQRITLLEEKVKDLETRINELEKTKLAKIKNKENNYDNFKGGYII